MQPFFMYILKCSDDSYYAGHTDNLEQRVAAHQSGEYPCYTTTRLPVKLVFAQDFATRAEALEAELMIKRWTRRKKEALIDGNFSQLKFYAKKNFK
jgi:putative endonuclease